MELDHSASHSEVPKLLEYCRRKENTVTEGGGGFSEKGCYGHREGGEQGGCGKDLRSGFAILEDLVEKKMMHETVSRIFGKHSRFNKRLTNG